MGSISYTALRALTGGASVNDTINRDVPMREALPTFRRFGSKNVSLNGDHEAVLDRIERRWAVTFSQVAEADLDAFVMFFQSVMNEETFSIDFLGTIAVPVTVRTVYMVSESIGFTRLARGNYRVGFEVVEP